MKDIPVMRCGNGAVFWGQDECFVFIISRVGLQFIWLGARLQASSFRLKAVLLDAHSQEDRGFFLGPYLPRVIDAHRLTLGHHYNMEGDLLLHVLIEEV